MAPPSRTEVTLIEQEAIAAAGQEYKLSFYASRYPPQPAHRGGSAQSSGRQDFHVGEVLLRGIELCEPCGHLEKLTCAGIKRSLIHRGGLRAQILAAECCESETKCCR